MAWNVLDWLRKRGVDTGYTNDVDYGSSIGRGGFDASRYGGYVSSGDDEVAMTPSQLFGGVTRAVKGASGLLNPNTPPPEWLQRGHDRIFGSGPKRYSGYRPALTDAQQGDQFMGLSKNGDPSGLGQLLQKDERRRRFYEQMGYYPR